MVVLVPGRASAMRLLSVHPEFLQDGTMRRSFRLVTAWGVVAIGGFVGVGGTLLAGMWLADGWAAAVGGGIAAVTAVATVGATRSIEARRSTALSLPEHVDLHGQRGAFPLVREVTDLVSVGVHPAETDGHITALPAYISREVDAQLRDAVDVGGLVVVVGESTAGKSRAAFEALLSRAPGHLLAVPARRTSLMVVAEELADRSRWVLWLDDLERFLGADGLTPAMLDRLIGRSRPDTVVLCTMRASEYDRFAARAEPNVDTEDRAAWRASREVLRRAHVVFVDRLWSRPDLERAARHNDVRVVRAVRQAHTFGIAETLTAGPVLLKDWRDAWSPGTHPRGAALVAAAVDCRRAGLDEPVSRGMLEELHEHYLTARGGHLLRPEDLAEAWQWALHPVHGASSLILPVGPSGEEQRLIAFDYLLDQPDNAPIPSETWHRLVQLADPEHLPRIASNAYWRVRTAFHAAIASGVVKDVYSLASAARDNGDFVTAIRLFRAELQAMRDREGADTGQLRSLRHQIAFYQLQAGDVEAAESEFTALLAEAEARLAPDDEYLQVVRHNIANCHSKRGDVPGALTLFRQILADRERYLGPLAMNTLATKSRIAQLIAESGDAPEAIRQMRSVLADEQVALGADHTNTLGTRDHLVYLRVEAGEINEAVDLSEALIPDLARALGQDHPEVREAETRHQQLLDKKRQT